jgi:hypothetical protein
MPIKRLTDRNDTYTTMIVVADTGGTTFQIELKDFDGPGRPWGTGRWRAGLGSSVDGTRKADRVAGQEGRAAAVTQWYSWSCRQHDWLKSCRPTRLGK